MHDAWLPEELIHKAPPAMRSNAPTHPNIRFRILVPPPTCADVLWIGGGVCNIIVGGGGSGRGNSADTDSGGYHLRSDACHQPGPPLASVIVGTAQPRDPSMGCLVQRLATFRRSSPTMRRGVTPARGGNLSDRPANRASLRPKGYQGVTTFLW
jgi:hypothetical protein